MATQRKPLILPQRPQATASNWAAHINAIWAALRIQRGSK